MPSNYFECCPCVNPMDSVPEALSNIVKYNKKQDVEIAKKVNEDGLSVVAKSGRYGDLIDKPVALPNPQPIIINGQRYDGSEAVTVTVSSEGGGTTVEIDDTLTQSGKAADAKAVGDRLSALNEANAALIEVSGTEPIYKNTELWINPSSEEVFVPQIEDSVISEEDTWSSRKISEEIKNAATGGTEIPSSLPNPHALVITGAVEATYDGSAQVSVDIPTGGGSSEYTLLAETTLEAETNHIWIDVDWSNVHDVWIEAIIYAPTENALIAKAPILIMNGNPFTTAGQLLKIENIIPISGTSELTAVVGFNNWQFFAIGNGGVANAGSLAEGQGKSKFVFVSDTQKSKYFGAGTNIKIYGR